MKGFILAIFAIIAVVVIVGGVGAVEKQAVSGPGQDRCEAIVL